MTIDDVISLLKSTIFSPYYGVFWGFFLCYLTNERWMILLSYVLIYSVHGFNYYNHRFKISGHWPPLSGRDVALITGGSRGLGSQIASILVQKGVAVVVLDILEPEYSLDNERLRYYKCDLADEDMIQSTLQLVERDVGTISILVNNAGIRHNESFLNLKSSSIKKMFQINLYSSIKILQEVIGRCPAKGRLFVVSVASILGCVGPANTSIYSATKGAMIQVHESLSHELRNRTNIRFLLVTPGQLDTTMFEDVRVSNKFLAPVVKSEDLAQKIVERIERGERGTLSLPFYACLLPILRVLPFSIQEFLRKFSQMDTQIKEH